MTETRVVSIFVPVESFETANMCSLARSYPLYVVEDDFMVAIPTFAPYVR